jgi:hypothetical protein
MSSRPAMVVALTAMSGLAGAAGRTVSLVAPGEANTRRSAGPVRTVTSSAPLAPKM